MTRADDLLERIAGITRRDDTSRMYRCPVCQDVGWIEVNPDGRGTGKRCNGPHSKGCPHDAHKLEEARKKKASEGKPTSGDQAAV